MIYVANNPILYNACLAGIAAAMGAGQNPAGTGSLVTGINAEQTAVALQVASATDTLITGDGTITSGGATIVPSTAAITNAQLSKSGAMRVIAFAAFDGQAQTTSLPAGAQAAIAAGIAAKYGSVIAAPFSLL